MVDDLGNRIDTAQEHVANVNTRMKVGAKDMYTLAFRSIGVKYGTKEHSMSWE